MSRADGSFRERAIAILVAALALCSCAVIAAAVRDLDHRTALRQRQLDLLGNSARNGAPGALSDLDEYRAGDLDRLRNQLGRSDDPPSSEEAVEEALRWAVAAHPPN